MKKLLGLALALNVLVAPFAFAASSAAPLGPAPNAGDSVSDGSGFGDTPYVRIGEGTGDGVADGPAPCSGDGLSDGPDGCLTEE